MLMLARDEELILPQHEFVYYTHLVTFYKNDMLPVRQKNF
jgi:hypothetical protein